MSSHVFRNSELISLVIILLLYQFASAFMWHSTYALGKYADVLLPVSLRQYLCDIVHMPWRNMQPYSFLNLAYAWLL